MTHQNLIEFNCHEWSAFVYLKVGEKQSLISCFFFFIQPVMQALQQRYAVTAGQPYVVPQRTQPVYIMAIQTDTGCSVPLVMDGVVSRNKFCNSLFSMLFYCGYGYAVSKMEFHITDSSFLGSLFMLNKLRKKYINICMYSSVRAKIYQTTEMKEPLTGLKFLKNICFKWQNSSPKLLLDIFLFFVLRCGSHSWTSDWSNRNKMQQEVYHRL